MGVGGIKKKLQIRWGFLISLKMYLSFLIFVVQSQLLRVQRMETFGRSFSGIAHDLNNELSPMLLSMRMLEHKQADAENRRWFETLRVSAQRAGRLITQLLSFIKGIDEERILIR